MAKPGRVKEIAKNVGEPVEDLLVRMLNEEKSVSKVANILGLSEGGLFRLMQRKGIQKETRWVKTSSSVYPNNAA